MYYIYIIINREHMCVTRGINVTIQNKSLLTYQLSAHLPQLIGESMNLVFGFLVR